MKNDYEDKIKTLEEQNRNLREELYYLREALLINFQTKQQKETNKWTQWSCKFTHFRPMIANKNEIHPIKYLSPDTIFKKTRISSSTTISATISASHFSQAAILFFPALSKSCEM